MMPTQNSFKEEIKHRLLLLEQSMLKINKSEILYLMLCNEHSIITEILNLIGLFENQIGYENLKVSDFTPILYYVTKEPLKIGDKVENPNSKVCGNLIFCDYNQKYLIKTVTGGNHHTTTFQKINEFYDYKIDSTKIECRRNPYKQKW